MQVKPPSSRHMITEAEEDGEKIDELEVGRNSKQMVAISMYRGNLHKSPDVPRRWMMPHRNLSFKDFKSLLHRRKRALSLTLNPNFNSELVNHHDDAIPSEIPEPSKKRKLVEVKREEIERDGLEEGLAGGSGGGDCPGERVTELPSEKEAEVNVPHEDAANETLETAEVRSEREKKQKEVEERLQVLNAKKHNLVQVLKQILNAEEELKSRSNFQQQGTIVTRPSLPLHVDVCNDSGGNMEGGETNEAANHHNNAQSRTVLRPCGASSSSESPLRRAAAFSQHNTVPRPSRWSPRLVPGQPGNPNPVTVTVSATGTNYIASSPSPAGSGGTSVFRESRLQSPWN